MITITLTYRDRDLGIVKKCLDSLLAQTLTDFKVILVDYGSKTSFAKPLKALVSNYSFVKLISCSVKGQLWNKSRAINIALKKCLTPYIFIGDIDMIYHQDFINELNHIKNEKIATYFKVGFLNKAESAVCKKFEAYNIAFKSNKEATGMTLYSTHNLKSINGFDEFYNGWGSEDTDVHIRLQNLGLKINYYDEKILILHQWHHKNYRNKNSKAPFHTGLEQINNAYLELTKKTGKIKVNQNYNWGQYNKMDYETLNKVNQSYLLTNKEDEVKAFIYNVLATITGAVIEVKITKHIDYKSIKQKAKLVFGKKTIKFLEMEVVNNLLLEYIINNLRNCAYRFEYNRKNKTINLRIKL